ncbi:MAG: MarC family protein [Planctomycetota bacterium]
MLLAELDLDQEITWFLGTFIVQAVLGLYIVINPPGISSVFLSVTRNASAAEKRGIALRAAIVGAFLLALFAVAGTYILQATKITGPTLQIAGGIFMFGLAYAMARGKEREFFGQIEEHHDEKVRRSVAYSPLAVPLIAGPASITLVMTLSAKAQGTLYLLYLLGAIAAVVFYAFLQMLRLVRLEQRFGASIGLIMPRIMGLLLAVIAVQFIVQGIIDILPSFVTAWKAAQ